MTPHQRGLLNFLQSVTVATSGDVTPAPIHTFIAFGAIFMTVVLTGASDLPWGIARLLAGLVFSLGLILVIVSGAELFTGDALMVVAYAGRHITLAALLRAWALVYVGNIFGALGTAGLAFLAGQYGFDSGGVGKTALVIASAKAALPPVQLFFLAVLCNVLVCLAVWMSFERPDMALGNRDRLPVNVGVAGLATLRRTNVRQKRTRFSLRPNPKKCLRSFRL